MLVEEPEYLHSCGLLGVREPIFFQQSKSDPFEFLLPFTIPSRYDPNKLSCCLSFLHHPNLLFDEWGTKTEKWILACVSAMGR